VKPVAGAVRSILRRVESSTATEALTMNRGPPLELKEPDHLNGNVVSGRSLLWFGYAHRHRPSFARTHGPAGPLAGIRTNASTRAESSHVGSANETTPLPLARPWGPVTAWTLGVGRSGHQRSGPGERRRGDLAHRDRVLPSRIAAARCDVWPTRKRQRTGQSSAGKSPPAGAGEARLSRSSNPAGRAC
jgi:hypothetical protein